MSPGENVDLHKIRKLCFEGERSWKRDLGCWRQPRIMPRRIGEHWPTCGYSFDMRTYRVETYRPDVIRSADTVCSFGAKIVLFQCVAPTHLMKETAGTLRNTGQMRIRPAGARDRITRWMRRIV